jgi:hypothetical protein
MGRLDRFRYASDADQLGLGRGRCQRHDGPHRPYAEPSGALLNDSFNTVCGSQLR